jgi:cytochrome b
MQRVTVWDLPTRIFHWSLFVLVITAYFTGEDEGLVYQIHVTAGYGIGLLLLFRLVWGVIGGRHARFTEFVRSLRDLSAYLRELRGLRAKRYVGHNPLGTLMVLVMMATLVAVLLSGLYGGEDLHEFLGEVIIVLAVVHVFGVLVDSLLTRENLIAAMITGDKKLSPSEAEREPGPPAPWRGLAALAVTLVIAILTFTQNEALKWPPPADGEFGRYQDGGGEEHGQDEGRD